MQTIGGKPVLRFERRGTALRMQQTGRTGWGL